MLLMLKNGFNTFVILYPYSIHTLSIQYPYSIRVVDLGFGLEGVHTRKYYKGVEF